MLIDKPIDVITTHTDKGEMKPIRFRITVGDVSEVYDLKSSLLIETQTISREDIILKYRCTFIDGYTQKRCEMHFHKFKTKWYMYKIE